MGAPDLNRVLWTPAPDRVRESRWTGFARTLGLEGGEEELYRFSVDHPAAFWSAIWDQLEVIGTRGHRVLEEGHRMPGARWFPEATHNFAENLLRRRDGATALFFRREDGLERRLTFEELAAEVGRIQRGLRELGLRPGDRVAAYLPHGPEAIVTLLAVTGLGGVWSSCSPDFGVAGALDRFAQVKPRFLLGIDGYLFKGKRHDCTGKCRELAASLPSLQRTILVDHLVPDAFDPGGIPHALPFRELRGTGEVAPTFVRLPFDHPLYILFSSGTTGRPKCIVHGAGGTLLQHLKEHRLHVDLGEEDRLFYYTTTGWMMWNWLVSALASGTSLVLFDGSPFHPRKEVLWDLADVAGITVFGTSAKYLDACRKEGLAPRGSHDLDRLRTVLSTGSPLLPEAFEWVYREVKEDLQLASISGGTDIVSCFVLGWPHRPVRAGEIQGPGLGMRVEIRDEEGQPVPVGEEGELVCSAPFPSMPLGFLGDADGSALSRAYFEKIPGVWCHGDWARTTPHGGFVILGRSDSTLNPGGVRIGTAEIYRQVEQLEEIQESLVVGQDRDGDQRIVLFVRLAPGKSLTGELQERVRRRIRENTTPRHVPAVILAVSDLPRTRSGKISELAARAAVHGRPIDNTGALANPEVLQEFRGREELA